MTKWADRLLSTIRGEAFRRSAGEASDQALAQVELGLVVVACLLGSGPGVPCYGAAKQVPHALPSAGVKQVAAAPDLPSEPPKGDASLPIDPKLLAKLADQLRSNDWDEPAAALTALEKLVPEKGAGKLDFGPVIEPLFDNCGWGGKADKDARRAEELIVRIGGQTAPGLRRRLGSPDAHDRRVAAELLVRVEPAGAGVADLLRPLLADKDNFVRRAAMQGLGAQGAAAKAAISDLEKATAGPNINNRVTASVALIHIAGASDERVGALADFLLLRKSTEDDAPGYAASELGKLGRKAHSAAPQLLAALKHPDAQVRIYAAAALSSVAADPNKAVPALIGMLRDDPEREARRSAAVALGDMGPASASSIPALREALRGDGGGWWVAADAIGKIGGPDAVAALIEALANKDDGVRQAAIQRLGDLGGADASTIEALQKAQKDDPQERNRKYAAEALKKITARPSPETFYGAAKQAPRTPPSAAVKQEAAPDLPSEPTKGDASVPIDPKLLAKLADQLRSKDWDERPAALTALEKLVPEKGAGKMDFGPVIEPLLDNCGWGGLGEENAHRAEELIVRIGEQAGPTLRRRLNVPDELHRSVEAELLVRVEPPGPGLTELLRPLLADGDHFVRRAAIKGLGAQGAASNAASSDLEKESTDPNRINRVAACVALINIAGPSEQRVAALADLLLLRKSTEDDAPGYAADELAKLGRQAHSAAPQLLAALKYPDVRRAAAWALGPVGADPDTAVPALIAMLKDEKDRAGRCAVAGALGAFGPAAASAIPVLRETLRSDGSDEDRGWVAADAIGRIGGPDAVVALVEALQNKDEQVRSMAIRWLGKVGGADASTIEALQKARKDDPQESNRKAAAEVLKKIMAQPSLHH